MLDGTSSGEHRDETEQGQDQRNANEHHIAYTTFTYPDTIHSANEVAPLLGVPADLVFKTLVVLADERRHLLIMVPVDKHFEMYLDTSSAGLDELFINGGRRGINLRLRVADLLAVTGARVIQATSEPTRNSTVR